MSGYRKRKLRIRRKHRSLLSRFLKSVRNRGFIRGRGNWRPRSPLGTGVFTIRQRFSTSTRTESLHPIYWIEVVVPTVLAFDEENSESTLIFFRKLRKALLNRKKRALSLEASRITSISPDAALVLIAELYHGDHQNPRLKKYCNFPTGEEVQTILQAVGFFDYFPKRTATPLGSTERVYLNHRHNRIVSGREAKGLIEFFGTMLTLEDEQKMLLYEALLECMNNVLEHAYNAPRRNYDPHHLEKDEPYREWWMLGYCDGNRSEICFSFYDQGKGIPKTIRARLRDSCRKGSSLIRQAMEEGLSSTMKGTRGRGLPSLKEFVDAADDGLLAITSLKSHCCVKSEGNIIAKEQPFPLQGTLITWNICQPGLSHEHNHDH